MGHDGREAFFIPYDPSKRRQAVRELDSIMVVNEQNFKAFGARHPYNIFHAVGAVAKGSPDINKGGNCPERLSFFALASRL